MSSLTFHDKTVDKYIKFHVDSKNRLLPNMVIIFYSAFSLQE